jgi:dissimilatory sulfite reductase (desulfoviridin) alpha/beta subunit
MDLPHKFKIAISGCPNTCTRPQTTDIGIHGDARLVDGEKRTGYTFYLAGYGGRTPRAGFKCAALYTQEEVLLIIERVVSFYTLNAKPRQRLALLVEEIGRDRFLAEPLPRV